MAETAHLAYKRLHAKNWHLKSGSR